MMSCEPQYDVATSDSAETGLSLFEKGGGPFFHVFGGETFAKGLLFAKEAIGSLVFPIFYGVSRSDIGAFDDAGDRDRGLFVDDREQLTRFGKKLVLLGDDII